MTREEVHVEGRPVLAHAADAVRAAGLVFVAGVLPVDADGRLRGGYGAGGQAQFVFDELRKILVAAGAEPADVVKINVYLTDVDDRPRINPVRQEFFGSARPASTLVEVSALAVPGAKVEVDVVAVAR